MPASADIPETVRKGKESRASSHKPQRSPIRKRSRCKPPDSNTRHRDDGSDDEDGTPPSPTPTRSIHTDEEAVTTSTRVISDRKQAKHGKGGRQHGQTKQQNDRGHQHLNRLEFLRLIRIQLAEDRGRDADAAPLYLSGSIGSLFKVRLSSYGYTLMAKGVQRLDLARLRHENEVPLFDSINQTTRADVVDAVAKAYKELHKLGILHGDAEPRNVLRDTMSGNIMVVDFCRPLGSLSSNGQPQKRNQGMLEKRGKGGSVKELESVIERVSRCITTARPGTATYATKMVRDV
ncbi:hypothetical protein EsDP_00006310 [Epichloe bromicola]|uniref:Protein kinase domain-containing protein n=1 Tax=Epichloe bromicola TaxID=79588 RepID=A0ABQ0CX84_9HYPO